MNYDKVPDWPDKPEEPVHRRGRVWLAGGLLLLVAGAAAWWQLGRAPAAPTGDQQQRVERIAALDAQLETVSAQLAALPADAESQARRPLLETALAAQHELLRLREPSIAADSLRLSQWEVQLDDVRAEEQGRDSRELEAAATTLLRQKQTAAAAEKLQAALRLQREINQGMSSRGMKSYAREAKLQQEVEELVAEPLLTAGQQALADARAAATGGSWADALQFYGRAREIQQQINRDFPRSRFSDLLAEGKIEAEMAMLGAGDAAAQRDRFMQQAAAAAGAGRLEEADRAYELAADRQQVINTQFAKSTFVSMEQLEQIEVERQTLRAGPRLEAVRTLDATVAGHLRRRELFQAQELLKQAVVQLEEAMRQWPKARGFDVELGERLNYLGRRASELVTVQDQTYDLLLPLPGRPQAALLRTELPQALFVLVMSTNPSRNTGRASPVDSVSQAEAGEFCRRLGWIMGAPVRLPAEAEMQAAAKAVVFKEVTGGLDEWLAAGSGEAATAAVFPTKAAGKTVARSERSRTTGFRIVVEVDLQAAR
jgi:hypothetical protein